MLRSPHVLAALADAALPRIQPRAVVGLPTRLTDKFQQARVESSDGQHWTVRVSRNAAAGASAEQADSFTRLLAKRVPFAVPVAEGRMTLSDRNLVTVAPQLPGDPMVWRGLTGGSEEAIQVGRALAALHDVDPRVADEVGVPSYDCDGYRSRRLAILDRAAGTGLVPSALLARWERALEEVSLWRFPTCITHGPLEGHDVFWESGKVGAIASWENAAVSDPADDFAALWVLAPSEAFDTVLESYSAVRAEAPDKHLERRIRLSAELQRITVLLDAVSTDDDALIDRRAAALRRLNEQTVGDESLMPAPPRRSRAVSADQLDELDDEDSADVDTTSTEPDVREDDDFAETDAVTTDARTADTSATNVDEQHLRDDDTVEIQVKHQPKD